VAEEFDRADDLAAVGEVPIEASAPALRIASPRAPCLIVPVLSRFVIVPVFAMPAPPTPPGDPEPPFPPLIKPLLVSVVIVPELSTPAPPTPPRTLETPAPPVPPLSRYW
jgi:hypothetical protein